MSLEVHEIVEGGPVSSHAFNKDRTKLAISPNNHEIHIYGRDGNGWALEDKLVQHDQRVTGIDWAPNSDRIVSCGQDRNAYVWVKDAEGSWKHTLVLLRINRAATCVKWSPQENKFAVGSGARLICVCYFDEENDWWVAKHIKDNIRSTVLCVDWHANNAIVAAGTADFKTIIFSCAIKGVDKKPAETAWGTSDKLRSWGSVLQEYSTPGDGWVHGVAFSPSGGVLAWVTHASTINFVDGNRDVAAVQTIKLNSLPERALVFVSEDGVVAAGHDCLPTLFTCSGGAWKLDRKIDEPKGDEGKKKEGRFAAMDRFRQLDSKASAGEEGTEITTIHQNSISEVSKYETGSSGAVTKVATSGVDGRLVVWAI